MQSCTKGGQLAGWVLVPSFCGVGGMGGWSTRWQPPFCLAVLQCAGAVGALIEYGCDTAESAGPCHNGSQAYVVTVGGSRVL